jgi:hypothetical protein
MAKSWKKPKCPPTSEWLNKMWHIPPTEHYEALKSKGILTHSTVWEDHEHIMLTKTSQTQKEKHCMSPLIQSAWE